MKKQITIDGDKMYVDGREVVFKEKEVKEWEPKGGDWHVYNHGEVEKYRSDECFREFGTEYQTKEQAEKARDAMRRFNRLLAYKMEFAPDWEPDWGDGKDKYTVTFNHCAKEWQVIWHGWMEEKVTVYFPIKVAMELVDKLNKGIVKL